MPGASMKSVVLLNHLHRQRVMSALVTALEYGGPVLKQGATVLTRGCSEAGQSVI